MIVANLPDREAVEIDKAEGFWILICRLDLVELRIRVEHTSDCDPHAFLFEVRLDGIQEFVELGRCMCAPIEHSPDWPYPVDVSDFPLLWRNEFLMLARLWSDLAARTQAAPALGNVRDEQDVRPKNPRGSER